MRAQMTVTTATFAALICVTLSGCSPSSSDAGSADPTASVPAASPTPTEEDAAWFVPESRYGLDCATIADDALVTAAAPSGSSADPLVTASGVGIAIPRVTSIISVGGNVCEWSNGAPQNDQYGINPEYSGIAVEVLPQADMGWSEMAASFGMPYDMRECNPHACSMSAAVGDAWVTLFGAGAIDPVATDTLFSAVIAAVEGAGSPAATVTPSRDRPQFGECEEVIPTTTVQAITGLADAGLNNDAGGWSAASEATLVADNFGCHWMSGDQMAIASSVTWVHDGRWAYERASAVGTFAPVSLAGLGPDDIATLRCDPDIGPSCAIDIALGPDWINVSGPDQALAIALAEAVVAGRG